MLYSSFPLAVYFTLVVYVCQGYSLSSSHPLLPHCVHKSLLCVCVSILALQIGFFEILQNIKKKKNKEQKKEEEGAVILAVPLKLNLVHTL